MWQPQAIYSQFLLRQPHLLFGENALAGLKTFPCTRLAVIHGSGLTQELKDLVIKASPAFTTEFIKKSWTEEPTVQEMQPNLKALEALQPDAILAIGGGSVLDGAKLLRCLLEFPFFNIQSPNFNMLSWSTRFLALPTTLGSGAEISSASVLYNPETATKEFVVTPEFLPELVIFDERFLTGAPKKTLYLSVIDALSHCIEGYVSNIDNPLSNIFAEKAISLLNNNIEGITTQNSRQLLNLQMGAYFAGIVQNHCIVGAAHAIAHQLTSLGYGHALAISLVLPAVIQRNALAPNTAEAYATLAQNAQIGKDYKDLIELVKRITAKIDLNSQKAKLAKDLPNLLNSKTFFQNAIEDKGGMGNPTKLTESYLSEILTEIIKSTAV